jgi:hypothetical protein
MSDKTKNTFNRSLLILNAFNLKPMLRWRQLNVIWIQETSLDAVYCTDYRSGWFCSTISIITFQRWFCWFQSYHSLEGIAIGGG